MVSVVTHAANEATVYLHRLHALIIFLSSAFLILQNYAVGHRTSTYRFVEPFTADL